MLQKEHMKQASVKKITKFTEEVYTEVMEKINQSTGYLNDTEKVMCAVLLSDSIYNACNDILGDAGIEVILEYVAQEKEKLQDDRKNDNQKRWDGRTV